MPSQPAPPHHLSLVAGVVHDIEATNRAFLLIHRHMNACPFSHFVAKSVARIDEPNVEARYLRAAARTGDDKRPAINFYARKHFVVYKGARQFSVLPHRNIASPAHVRPPSRYTNQEEHAPAGVREIASPRDPIKQHDRKRPPKPNFIVGRTLSGKLNIDGYVLQITHVGRKTRVRSAFMNRTVQNKPSVFGLEPLNKRKAEHLIAHLGCKYDSDWDATFHAVEHFTVVILASKTNGTRRLTEYLMAHVPSSK